MKLMTFIQSLTNFCEIFEKSNTQKSKYFIKNDDHMMNFDQNLISEFQKFIKSLK